MAAARMLISVAFTASVLLYAADATPAYQFGSKTPYHHGDLGSLPDPPGCKAVHLNMLLRHGARFPSKGDKKAMLSLTERLNRIYNQSNPYTYKNLTLPWHLPKYFSWVMKTELSPRGEQEHYGIAKRFKARFPEVFNRSYWNAFYKFVTSDTRRTAQSAVSFAYGAFEDQGPLGSGKYQPVAVTYSGPEDNDKLLRPYDACQRYIKEIDDGPGMDEFKRFANNSEMRQVLKNLATRLNVTGKMAVTADIAEKLFRLCAFGTFNDGDPSWCSLFEAEDLNVLEYNGDLEAYYENSYGNKLAYEISCPLVAEIVNSLKDFPKNRYPFGIFRFAHSGIATSFMSILGMFNDTLRLRADNYKQQSNRNFKVSNNVPLAANMAFVLYQCNASTEAEKYRVRVLLNEEPAPLPCCPGNSTCTLAEFVSCYQSIASGCDFEAMCRLPSSSTPPASHMTTKKPMVCSADRLVVSMAFLLITAVLMALL